MTLIDDSEKERLGRQLLTLLEMNEPEAILVTLRKIYERASTQLRMSGEEAKRYRDCVEALILVEDRLDSRTLGQKLAEPPDGAQPNV